MPQANPIQLFVTHAWDDSIDYLRVFEYLESANNFFYTNCSTPDHMPAGDKEALRESLRRQIAPAEVVIALPEPGADGSGTCSSSRWCLPRPATSPSC